MHDADQLPRCQHCGATLESGARRRRAWRAAASNDDTWLLGIATMLYYALSEADLPDPSFVADLERRLRNAL
jgi:hypothetical protein